jgi:hypothetical protein
MAKAWVVRLYVHGKKERGRGGVWVICCTYLGAGKKKFLSSLAAVISSIIRNGLLVLEEKQLS